MGFGFDLMDDLKSRFVLKIRNLFKEWNKVIK